MDSNDLEKSLSLSETQEREEPEKKLVKIPNEWVSIIQQMKEKDPTVTSFAAMVRKLIETGAKAKRKPLPPYTDQKRGRPLGSTNASWRKARNSMTEEDVKKFLNQKEREIKKWQ